MQDNYIISDIPPVAFGGIYALIDNNGKMYIGSSKNIKQRVSSHQTHFKTYLRDGVDGFINPAMKEAMRNGLSFKCEVLAKFNCDLSSTERREIERIFISKFSKLKALYNYSVIIHKV